LALIGWLSGVRFLAGEWGIYIPMAPSTASAFLLLSIALFFFARLPAVRLSRLFALTAVSIVFLLGLLVLVQFFAGIDLGVEQVLSPTNEFLVSTPLGRMSPLTAVAFLLESAAFFILLIAERWRNAPTAAALLATGATGINAAVLIGYAFGAPLLYGGTIIPVALPTAIAFVLVGVGQINLALPGVPAWRAWSRASMRGILLRAFLPLMLFFVLLDDWVDTTFQPMLSLTPAVWYSLKVLATGVLIVVMTGWIARRTGSEIERAQETLAESEERYRLLFENSGEAILLTRSDGTIHSANPEACQIFGRSEDEIRKLGRGGVIDTNDPRLPAALEERKRTGQFKGELNLLRKDSTIFPGEVSTTVFKDSSGAERTSMIIRDLTEHKRAEEALRESEELMRYIVSHDPNAIAVYDRNLHYLAVSDRYLKDEDVREQDIIGKHLYEVFPEMPQRWKDVHQRCLAGAIERDDDDRFEQPDGSIIYNRWECRPWHLANGDIGGMITYTEVTTERKRAEEEIKKQLGELQRWQDATLGRETRILDLKREVNELLGQAGKPPRYSSAESQTNQEK
jgi:PAS domain S-box-containing protein